MSAIELIDLSKTIKKNTVIDHVNLSFQSGTIVGLKGINGSGKTMLMRLIIGLIRPTEGKALVDGKELGKDISFPPSIGILLENPSFLDTYSGKENLKILASIKSIIDDKRIDDVMTLVGLQPQEKKKFKKYSLGMKQRLGIAAAIMEAPDIIILDEPTNSLDSNGVEMVKKVVKQEKDRGALIILACHDLEVLRNLADDIYVIEHGKVIDHMTEVQGK